MTKELQDMLESAIRNKFDNSTLQDMKDWIEISKFHKLRDAFIEEMKSDLESEISHIELMSDINRDSPMFKAYLNQKPS